MFVTVRYYESQIDIVTSKTNKRNNRRDITDHLNETSEDIYNQSHIIKLTILRVNK